MHIIIKNKFLILDDYRVKCAIGKRGIKIKKKEGDLITPKGTYNLSKLLYRKDRIKNLKSRLKKIIINKNMGWCDDPNNAKIYNKLIQNKKNIKCENLYRADRKYDLIIPIKYNFFKPVKSKGSCIFIHLTNNYKPTAGCIALKRKDFLIMLKIINKKTKIYIN